MSDTSLAVIGPHEIDLFTDERVELIRKTIANGAPPLEFAMFLEVCKKSGLDPISRQIYFIQRGGKWSWQTSIDGYRAIADRTGAYAGSDDAIFTEGPGGKPGSATVTVYKIVQGIRCPFSATARWSEYQGSGPMWQKMPHTMLAKCAESLALRKAFPTQLSGLYTKEEMAQAERDESEDASFRVVDTDTGEVTYEPPLPPVAPQRPAPQPKPTSDRTPGGATLRSLKFAGALQGEVGISDDDIHRWTQEQFGKASRNDLDQTQMSKLIEWLQSLQHARPAAPPAQASLTPSADDNEDEGAISWTQFWVVARADGYQNKDEIKKHLGFDIRGMSPQQALDALRSVTAQPA